MHIFSNPDWLNQFNHDYHNHDEIPDTVFTGINKRLDQLQTKTPVVSIVVAAWNEEVNVLNCIASLSRSVTQYPVEIIVINNNSTDKTQDTLDKLHVKSFFQKIQGWGPARQMGLEKASGKYILLADADCFYPENWIEAMVNGLEEAGVVCVYGRYSFISEPGYPRWKLSLLENLKDTIAALRHFKRPYLNAFGMTMGYIREHGLQVGYVMHKIRGEDGRMCFDLMQFGSVKQIKAANSRIWTSPRSLQRDGSFGKALLLRIVKEIKRFGSMFVPHPPHDTKTSTND